MNCIEGLTPRVGDESVFNRIKRIASGPTVRAVGRREARA